MHDAKPEWTILSSHGRVLFHIAANPNVTIRELSDTLGLSERWIAHIVKDLAAANLIRVQRRGLHNSYKVSPNARFRDPTLAHIPLAPLLQRMEHCVPGNERDAQRTPLSRRSLCTVTIPGNRDLPPG